MQDLIEEFGIRSVPESIFPASERATVLSLLRWLPQAYLALTRRLKQLSATGLEMDVLVHGDTLSTLIGAVAGRRRGARLVHLESGLTSGRLLDPFPEEVCRRLVFRMTDLAMCPNAQAATYMRKHHRRAKVVDTGGNTIIDAVALTGAAAVCPDTGEPYVVASLHRFQNLYDGTRLHSLVALIERISAVLRVHFVLHPATRKRLRTEGLEDRLRALPGVALSPRLGYGAFLRLAAGAACVLTDGGSNQEELAALGVPTIVMRERTERPDGLGANALMEADVPGGVFAFLQSAGYRALRRPVSLEEGPGPSSRIAAELTARPRALDG
jgi:UDP-N-acetylglucosamine 2-epimerase (non-hydrolysing)